MHKRGDSQSLRSAVDVLTRCFFAFRPPALSSMLRRGMAVSLDDRAWGDSVKTATLVSRAQGRVGHRLSGGNRMLEILMWFISFGFRRRESAFLH